MISFAPVLMIHGSVPCVVFRPVGCVWMLRSSYDLGCGYWFGLMFWVISCPFDYTDGLYFEC
jgi:hypothetical protein